MSISKNDPKLTAYVLNELPEKEMQQMAEEIKNNPQLQAEVTRIKGNILLLKKLKQAETFRLDPARREMIFGKTQPTSLWSKYNRWAGGLAVASLALVIFVKNESSLKSAASKPHAEAPFAASKEVSKPGRGSEDAIKITPQKKALPAHLNEAGPAAPAPVESAAELQTDSAAKAKDNFVTEQNETPSEIALGASSARSRLDSTNANQAPSMAVASGGAVGGAYMLREDSGRGANAPAAMKSKMFAAKKAGDPVLPAAPPAIHETENYRFEIVNSNKEDPYTAAALLKPMFSCFENSLSRYAGYDVEFTIYWRMQNGDISEYGSMMERISGAQLFTEEAKCLEPKLRETLKSALNLDLRGKQRIRLILRSK
jgi:hypothetical protein